MRAKSCLSLSRKCNIASLAPMLVDQLRLQGDRLDTKRVVGHFEGVGEARVHKPSMCSNGPQWWVWVVDFTAVAEITVRNKVTAFAKQWTACGLKQANFFRVEQNCSRPVSRCVLWRIQQDAQFCVAVDSIVDLVLLWRRFL